MYTNLARSVAHHTMHFLLSHLVKIVCTLGVIVGIRWGGGTFF